MTDEVIRKNVQGKQDAAAKELELKAASSDFDTALNVCRTKAKEYRQAINRTGFPSPAELEAATPPSPPYAPKDAVFERGTNGNGTIKITPPDKSGGANITDYIATITPAGPVLGPADFRNSSMPTISVTSIDDSEKWAQS